MARREVFLDSVGDVDLLPLVLDAANRFHQAPAEAEMEAMLMDTHSEPLFV
jgi:hypothetical protein